MCGIAAIMAKQPVKDQLVAALEKLEYRGYDSAGVATKEQNQIKVTKQVGKVSMLKQKLQKQTHLGIIGIAHTRWATHGPVTQQNSHPFESENWCLVHNGIINNFEQLKVQHNITTDSQTDTEVIVHMLEQQPTNDIFALINVCKQLKGSYALAVLNKNTNSIYLAKQKSPLFVAAGQDMVFCASDVVCFAEYCKQFYKLEDGEFCQAELNKLTFFNQDGKIIEKQLQQIQKIEYETDKQSFAHYMEKEIFQTPQVAKNIYQAYKQNLITLPKDFLKGINRVKFVGCGTAYHSTLFGAKCFEKATGIESTSHLASEFEHEFLTQKTLCVFVSQSGETADTLGALAYAKQQGCKTLAITNVMHSTIASAAHFCLPILAGVEIAVASTKAYSAQIMVMNALANHFAPKRKQKQFWKQFEHFANNLTLPNRTVLDVINQHIGQSNQCFVLGRGQDFFTAQEAALKIKEITYINCNAMPCGELKHGTLALIDNTTPIIVICTSISQLDKSISAQKEMEARGGNVLLVTPFKDHGGLLQHFDNDFMPISAILPFQICAYEIALMRGNNPDQPRNLAKSVTVE